jgi:hypothetical protein
MLTLSSFWRISSKNIIKDATFSICLVIFQLISYVIKKIFRKFMKPARLERSQAVSTECNTFLAALRFDVFVALKIKSTTILVLTPDISDGTRSFRGKCCLHLQCPWHMQETRQKQAASWAGAAWQVFSETLNQHSSLNITDQVMPKRSNRS